MSRKVLAYLVTTVLLLVFVVPLVANGSSGGKGGSCGGGYCNFNVRVIPFDSTDSQPALGANVAQALQHQVFRQLQVDVPLASGETICCLPSDAIVLGEEQPLLSQTREEAVARGRDVPEGANYGSAQLVVWGKAWPWRDRVVVQTFLSVLDPPRMLDPSVRISGDDIPSEIESEILNRRRPFNREGEWRIWEIPLDAAVPDSESLYIDRFPRTFYEMPQISLDANDVAKFRSLDELDLYRDEGGEFVELDAHLDRTTVRAVEHRGEYTKIADPADIWIKLPSVEVGEVDDFIGGIMYFLRGNWERARSSFEAVADNTSVTSSVRVDAALLLAATQYRLDPACSACSDAIAVAKRINPYSPVTARFEFMTKLAQALAAGGEVQALRSWLEQEPALFDPEDRFTVNAKRFLDRL